MPEITIEEIRSYHEAQADYCRMTWKQSWGRSADFKQTWKDRERFHRRAAKQITRPTP